MSGGFNINQNKNGIDYSNSIKKSNEISMAELNYGLNLSQMQLLAFAIYSTQQNGQTNFRKYELQNKFEVQQYRTEDAYKDSDAIMDLKVSIKDLENDYFKFTNVFTEMEYDKGNFSFEWNPKIIPHILELKQRYIITDLKIAAHFKSSFSWRLYEYLKAHYGYWHKYFSKEELMNLFAVEDKKTYQKSTAQLKRGVLDVAINEVNQFTELEVWYKEQKVGNKIIGFKIHWSAEKQEIGATEKQLALLKEIYDEVDRRIYDYFSLKNTYNLELARNHVMKVKEIDSQVSESLSSKRADELIKSIKMHYQSLQKLLENDEEKRDTSVYFDWTKGEE